jgi:uncharacterized protein (DUF58 family)
MIDSRARTLGLLAIGLLLAALASRVAALAWLALPFIAYLGAGLLKAPVLEDLSLRAKRDCLRLEVEGESRIKVLVAVRNEGAKTLHVTLSDSPPLGLSVASGSPFLRTSLRPGEEAELSYELGARRGSYSWKELRVRASDPLGLVALEIRLSAEARVRMHPRLRKMPSLLPRLRKTLSSPGSIPIGLGGSGTDFWGIREYRQGDPLKRLYWRLNARNPLKRYTKEFVQERTAEIVLVLDARRQSELEVGGESLFEREVEAVAALARMFLRQGQRVGLCVHGQRIRNLVPDYGKVQLLRILDCLADAEPDGEGILGSFGYLPALRYSRTAFLILMTPFSGGDESLFQRFRALGYRAILVSPDTLDFASSLIPKDEAHEAALRACRIERKIALDKVARLSYPVVDWKLGEDLVPLLKSAFRRLGTDDAR